MFAVRVAVLLATATVAIVVVLQLARTPSTSPPEATSRPPDPPPLRGTVFREAGFAGEITVGVAATGQQLQVVLLGPPGPGTELSADLSLPGEESASPVRFVACGDGCGTADVAMRQGVSRLSVKASAPGWVGGTYSSSIAWPPPPLDGALLTKVIGAMRATPRLTLREVLTSGPYRAKPDETTMSGFSFVLSQLFLVQGEDVRALPAGNGLSLYVPGKQY
ncbi:MAG TPA: hypothetical protein VGS21_08395, partial [Acidimicrobiales bacterium]|nr:hypothetical protein [Acidimicrobiales bacterium]